MTKNPVSVSDTSPAHPLSFHPQLQPQSPIFGIPAEFDPAILPVQTSESELNVDVEILLDGILTKFNSNIIEPRRKNVNPFSNSYI